MDNPKRARSEKPRKQPRECAYVRSPDLQSALERIRQVACRDKEPFQRSVVSIIITLDTPLLEPVRSERLPDFAPAYTSTPE